MNLAEDLKKLEEMHRSGALSDEEFARAKAAILSGSPPPPASPPVQSVPPTQTKEQETRQWASFVHLSQLAGLFLPMAGIVLPIVLWQVKKNDLPGIDAHGKIVANWLISEIIYSLVCIPLICLLIGIPLLIILLVVGIVFPIIGCLKASNGEAWTYPLSIAVLK